jgi:oligoribonuclease (3'-5' exoribonuclease)
MDLMVDLETLDTENTAALISIGAVVFDPETSFVDDRTFHVNVDWDSATSHGTFSESTINFWERQSEEAQAALFEPAQIDLKTAIQQFDDYVKSWKPKPRFIWGNSPRFDISILLHAYNAVGMEKFPYLFWKEMDVRTLKNLLPKELLPPRIGVYHSAVDDCRNQCRIVQLFHGVEL